MAGVCGPACVSRWRQGQNIGSRYVAQSPECDVDGEVMNGTGYANKSTSWAMTMRFEWRARPRRIILPTTCTASIVEA